MTAELGYELDEEANALYVRLSGRPYAYGHDLDPERRVDFDIDGHPIGVELLCVRGGVSLNGLPERDRIASLLQRLKIRVFA
jgi:hypothetical protein